MPTNDNLADAVTLTGNFYSGDNTGFTTESGEISFTTPSGKDNKHTAWHKWTPNSSFTGPFIFQCEVTYQGPEGFYVQMLTGNDVSSMFLFSETGQNSGELNYLGLSQGDIIPNTEYKIRLGNGSVTSAGIYNIFYTNPQYVAPASTPANNAFSNAITLSGTSISGDNTLATIETNENVDPINGDYPPKKTVWYKWIPNVDFGGNATFTLNLENPRLDSTFIEILEGSTLLSLTSLLQVYGGLQTPTDEISLSLADLTPLTTYYIRVGSLNNITTNGSNGPFTLTYTDPAYIAPPPPANDNFANATVLTGTSIYGDNTSATVEPGEDDYSGYVFNSVWYKWTPIAGWGNVAHFRGEGYFEYNYGPNISIHRGSELSNLIELNMNDYSTDEIVAEEDHYIRVYSAGPTSYAAGAFTLYYDDPNVLPTAPANDDFANAKILTGTSTTGDTTWATQELNEPGIGDSGSFYTVWFKWTAPEDFIGDATIDTVGSNFDTYLFIYTGIAIEDLVEIASDDDGGGDGTSEIIFTPTPLETYYIRVGGYSEYKYGNYVLNYPQPAPSGYKRGYGISRY